VRLQVFFYFLTLGLGYLFMEMVLIQRLVCKAKAPFSGALAETE
jgi:hypothetical protein